MRSLLQTLVVLAGLLVFTSNAFAQQDLKAKYEESVRQMQNAGLSKGQKALMEKVKGLVAAGLAKRSSEATEIENVQIYTIHGNTAVEFYFNLVADKNVVCEAKWGTVWVDKPMDTLNCVYVDGRGVYLQTRLPL